MIEFSFRTRDQALQRFQKEVFDLLVIGGGITGAAVAREATQRGLKVALVDRGDFACGTSSKSSKLIHGGLRYLESFDFKLVFEALAERSLLLKTAPHMVRPIAFYFPVYRNHPQGMNKLSAGLWLYDLLALLRTPAFHKRLNVTEFLRDFPKLNSEGLMGGFRYYDATMWDDVLTVEVVRSAAMEGAAVANYVEAVTPLWTREQVRGFLVRDLEDRGKSFELRAHATVFCGGPWTDELGHKLSEQWKDTLNPSKGIHLVFDSHRLDVPGALVMSHREDGRIMFVIPRKDLGDGVTIVGTTDGPVAKDSGRPEDARVESDDVAYLMKMLDDYFPDLKLTNADIVSTYVGVRPLMREAVHEGGKASLQKVTREHTIGRGPGGITYVVGGKYTTHRTMAAEIVDQALKHWMQDAAQGLKEKSPPKLVPSHTERSLNPRATHDANARARAQAEKEGLRISEKLWDRYGSEAVELLRLHMAPERDDPPGFPLLGAQLRFSIRAGMVLHLEDFFFRRVPLFLSRADHGRPWIEEMSRIWAEETMASETKRLIEVTRLEAAIESQAYESKLSKDSAPQPTARL